MVCIRRRASYWTRVNATQFNKIQDLIQKGIDEGARLVAGGIGRPEGFNKGFYVRPTVFADVNNSMTIAQEEIFGPVLSIILFDTEEEAIALANDTVYGLTNYIQTQDQDKAKRVARSLRSGMVEMNGHTRGGSPLWRDETIREWTRRRKMGDRRFPRT